MKKAEFDRHYGLVIEGFDGHVRFMLTVRLPDKLGRECWAIIMLSDDVGARSSYPPYATFPPEHSWTLLE